MRSRDGAWCDHRWKIVCLTGSGPREARTDPNVPPLPPHITLQQAREFLSSLPAEPERTSVILGSAKEMLASILPSRKP
ncbi:hypothetical protein [Gluconacetobacter diazotrophicus]|uniref:hypothetical protein n=1 Tax=Gluconacetobacter diazotrophicus TaxID=33996 RepID=UPI0036F2BDC8